MEITRFAPSPTGHLHLGGARTALFSYLFAKANNGKFLLRFEDTDQERSKEEYVDSILNSLNWMKIKLDSDPVYQSKKVARHKELAIELYKKGFAYACDCSEETLTKMREEQIAKKEKPKYNGLNRDKNIEFSEGMVLRFKFPLEGISKFKDLILGDISINNKEFDDFIILRSDGSPTYNFSAAVDDMDMKITTVIRGDDHITNTLKQINVLDKLNATIPNYAHLPMVLAESGKRLSKRDGAEDILDYKKNGYLSDALINYLVRLGWTHGEEEIFSLEQLQKIFNLKDVNSSPSKFSQDLLDWYNNKYLNFLTHEELIIKVKENTGVDFNEIDNGKLAISLLAKGANSFKQIGEESIYFFKEPHIKLDLLNIDSDKRILFSDFSNKLKDIDFEKDTIEKFIKLFLQANDLKFPELGKPLRVILTGKENAPSISELLFILGKETSLKRIEYTLND
jgi:glutamyl-tRNA synthetase